MTTKQKDLIDRVLKLLDERSSKSDSMPDRALWHMLAHHRDELPVLDGYFHKAFRQVDVTDSGHHDMTIWCLLYNSTLFWECLTECRKRKKAVPSSIKAKDSK